jgi:CDP-L-myo-inositol myo-inositolphosphotransferase
LEIAIYHLTVKAVILAAGRGKRLGSLTDHRPKPLIIVAGKPLLVRILESLKQCGIEEAVIVIGYRGNMIKQMIGDTFDNIKLQYVKNPKWGEQDNLYSLLAASELVNEDFLLCMSDHLFDPRIVKSLVRHGRKGLVTLAVDNRKPSPEDTKVLAKNGRIVDIGKAIPKSNCVDTGILLCSPKIFEYAKQAAKKGDALSDCIKLIAESGSAYVFDLNTIPSYLPKMRRHAKPYWIDIDTPGDLKSVEKILIEHASKEPSDLIAKYLNKPLENKLVLLIANTRITPNQVTLIVNAVAYLVTYLFLTGQLLVGAILAFLVGILDGIDGKLARIRGQESKLGLMEHPFDLLFEFSWYIALALYLHWTLESATPLIICLFILLMIAFYRFIYDQFRKSTGMSLDDYGTFERYFRRIAGRRNLYNVPILLGALFNAPFYALVAISCHATITAIVYAWRACSHLYKLDLRGQA